MTKTPNLGKEKITPPRSNKVTVVPEFGIKKDLNKDH